MEIVRLVLSCAILCCACAKNDGGTGSPSGSAVEANGATPAGAGRVSGSGAVDAQVLEGLRVRFVGATFSLGERELTKLLTAETGVAPTRIHTAAGAAALTVDDLADEDVLVLDDLARVYTEAEAALLADWVNAGHGLIAAGAFEDDSSRAASLTGSYGVSYVPGLIDTASPGTYVTELAIPALTNGVSSLLLYGAFRLATANENATAFATLPPDRVGLAITHGAGRVVVWGDDWILSDQELLRKDKAGSQPTSVFWTNALGWVSQRD